jgi:hypothetical protein
MLQAVQQTGVLGLLALGLLAILLMIEDEYQETHGDDRDE